MDLLPVVGKGVNVQEQDFDMKGLCEAEEIFLTNSIQEIVAVDRIYDHRGEIVWHKSHDGALVAQLHAAYRQAALLKGEG
jgi:4-amino-4-deoxychorismate lyase